MIKGEFIDFIDVGEVRLCLWRNPENGNLTAFDIGELPAANWFYYDACTGQKVMVEDTWTGLPK
jgi:hypothetical protein